MNISQEVIEALTYLMPGFIFMSIVRVRCVTKDLPYQYYIINSLIVSVIIYFIVAAFGVTVSVTRPLSVGIALFIAIIGGLLWSVVINRDYLALILYPGGGGRISTHDHIYPVKAANKFSGKWHVVRLAKDVEICGVIREFDVQSHEMLIENGRLVLPNGELSPESAWYYIPAGQGIIYLRTLEEGGYNEQQQR